MRQVLVFIKFGPKFGPAEGRPVQPSIPVQLGKGPRPTNVWTLWQQTQESVRPALPIVPRHCQNAFHEDYVHDWNFDERTGVFRYYSRITDEPVWVLLEYKD